MGLRDEYVKETVLMLKERYGASLPELIEHFQGSVSVPATVFDTVLTPLETVSQYLSQHKGMRAKDIAAALGRRKSVVDAALRNAGEKEVTLPEDAETPYRVPLSAFTDELAPAEAVVWSLKQQYNLPNARIAKLLGKDPRNTWELLRRAEEKMGGGGK